MKKRLLQQFALLGLLASQLLLVHSVNAEIFKCTNAKGSVYYNDKPCPVADDEKKMRSEKDVANGYVPPAIVKEQEQARRKGVVIGDDSSKDFDLNNKDEPDDKKEEKDTDSNKSNGSGGSSNAGNSGNNEASDNSNNTRESNANNTLPPLTTIDQGERKTRQKLTLKQKKDILNIRRPHR